MMWLVRDTKSSRLVMLTPRWWGLLLRWAPALRRWGKQYPGRLRGGYRAQGV